MTTKKSTRKQGAQSTPDDVETFARLFAEVMRIAKSADFIPTSFYNDLADAWNEFQNDTGLLTDIYHSETYIRLALVMYAEAQEKGGAR